MNAVLVDTGAWYAYLDQNDPDHQQTIDVLEQYAHALSTTNFIVDETLTLLRYRAGRHAAIQFGNLLFSGEIARLEQVTKLDQKKAWRLFQQYEDHCFSFTDCTSFALMERLKIETAVALDSDFRSYGLNCLPTI